MNGASKQCAECSLCCHVFPIPELGKNAGAWCSHHRAGHGCAIHAERPRTCRDFDCLWLQDATLGPEWKPTVSRMVLALEANGDALTLKITTHPGWPKAWTRQPYLADIRRWAAELSPTRRAVCIYAGDDVVFALPGREITVAKTALAGEGLLRFVQDPTGWTVALGPAEEAAA